MRRVAWAVPAAALAAYLLTGLVQVRPGERAVVRRFGRVLPVKPEPGLWVGLPWGMDRVDRVEVDKVRQVGVGYGEDEAGSPTGQFPTGDHNLVNVRALVYYKVSAERTEAYVAEGGPRVEALLGRQLEAAVGEWIAGQGVDEALLRGKVAMRAALLLLLRGRVEGASLGVELLDVRVEQIAPPDEVKDAFDNVSRAQTRKATLALQAEQEADTRRRLASAGRYQIDQAAQAYAHSTALAAGKDADRFRVRLRQYQAAGKSPEYVNQIWQEERGRLLLKLRDAGGVDLLDHRLNDGGLDLIAAPGRP